MTNESGVFFVELGASYFSEQGQKGGCSRKKRGGVPAPHSLNSFVFCGLSLLIGFPRADTEKSGETIATPPKRGVPTGPDSGTVFHAPIRPQGVAIVGIYPCGKARKRRPGAARIKRRVGPMELRKNWRKLTTAWTTTATAVLKRSREQVIDTDSGRPATP